MSKTLDTIESIIINKEAFCLIKDFFYLSQAKTLEEYHSEMKTFIYDVILCEKQIDYKAIQEATNMLDSLTLDQLNDAREDISPQIPTTINLDDCYFPLRRNYLSTIDSEDYKTQHPFINKGQLYWLEKIPNAMKEKQETYTFYHLEGNEYKIRDFKKEYGVLIIQ